MADLLRQEAMILKEKGNQFFKTEQYEKAVELYSKSLALDAKNPVVFSNRAMAFLKLKEYTKAQLDCDDALKLDDTFTKAYFRKGVALTSLGNHLAAAHCFQLVLQLEPENKEAKEQLKKASTEVVRLQLDKANIKTDPDASFLRVVNANRSTALKRVEISEVLPSSGTPMCDCMVQQTVEVSSASSSFNNSAAQGSVNVIPPVPTTSYQVVCDWRQLQSDRKALAKYFGQIDPSAYPKVFGESLDDAMLEDIFDIVATSPLFDDQTRHSELFNALLKLSEIPRFSTIFSFLSTTQKKTIPVILEKLVLSDEQSSLLKKVLGY